MDGKGLKIRFEADESPVRSALTRVEKSIKSIAKDLKEVDKLLELDPDNINLLTQKQEQLGTAITRTTKNLQAMENANGDMTKGYLLHYKEIGVPDFMQKSALVDNSELFQKYAGIIFKSGIFFRKKNVNGERIRNSF